MTHLLYLSVFCITIVALVALGLKIRKVKLSQIQIEAEVDTEQ